MTNKVTISSEEFDDYLNIEFAGKEYRTHYHAVPDLSDQPCWKCGIVASGSNMTSQLETIGAIYDESGYCLLDSRSGNYDAILQAAIEQIKKKRCITFCTKHWPLDDDDFDEMPDTYKEGMFDADGDEG